MRRGGADPGCGALRAMDVATGERKWEVRTTRPSTGQRLWNYQTGAAIYASPITYLHDGKQYVLLGSGTTLTAYALR